MSIVTFSNDILRIVVSFLNVPDIGRLMQTHRNLLDVTTFEPEWQRLCERRYRKRKGILKMLHEERSWMQVCKEMVQGGYCRVCFRPVVTLFPERLCHKHANFKYILRRHELLTPAEAMDVFCLQPPDLLSLPTIGHKATEKDRHQRFLLKTQVEQVCKRKYGDSVDKLMAAKRRRREQAEQRLVERNSRLDEYT
eukprot:GILJ01011285.1.p1 GENE.GILJ01011285.1~~GILJ01011285.1.p1  ORF type:complete len:195 (-),score=10.03 GILJ01011285.1:368-952(-)